MQSCWKHYWLFTFAGFSAVAVLGFLNLGTASSIVFFLIVIAALNPLDKVRKEEGDYMPLLKGSALYFVSITIFIVIQWYEAGLFEMLL